MRKLGFVKCLFIIILAQIPLLLYGQKSYSVSGGEWIFSGSHVVENSVPLKTNMRFTFFFHLEQEFHYDLSDFIGFYTGIGIRNVGLILDDYYSPLARNVKIKHRSYSLGVPAVIKFGSFKKNAFLYGGCEFEYMFHYKQKLYIDNTKWKFSEWNSRRVNRINPSVFAGFQFPSGINIKAKYYLFDFLNRSFTGMDFNNAVDYSSYESSQLFYIAVSFKVGKKTLEKLLPNDDKTYQAQIH